MSYGSPYSGSMNFLRQVQDALLQRLGSQGLGGGPQQQSAPPMAYQQPFMGGGSMAPASPQDVAVKNERLRDIARYGPRLKSQQGSQGAWWTPESTIDMERRRAGLGMGAAGGQQKQAAPPMYSNPAFPNKNEDMESYFFGQEVGR